MKLNIDLSPHFWIGLVIFVCTAISSGTINLTHAIPDDTIPYVTAWSSILSVVGTGYLTAALGLHNASPQAKIDVAAALPEVKGIVVQRDVAAAAPSDKVVATAAELPVGVAPKPQ